MKCIALLTVTVAFVCSAPFADSYQPRMEQVYEQTSSAMFIRQANKLLAIFGDYIPAVMKKELIEFMGNPDEVEELCEFMGKNGAYEHPLSLLVRTNPNQKTCELDGLQELKGVEEVFDVFARNLLLSAPRFERVRSVFAEKFARLSKPGQDFIVELQAKAKLIKGEQDTDTMLNLGKLIIEEIVKYNALADSVKNEFNAQYPEIVKFFHTSEFRKFAVKMEALKGKSDEEILNGIKDAVIELEPFYKNMD